MKRLFGALIIAVAAWTAACSSGGGGTTLPPPVGGFGLNSLNGQYAFVTSGQSSTGGPTTLLARVGSFTADGAGNITGGIEDVNADGTVTNAIAITGGTYNVNADGRGFITLQLGQSSIEFGITLTSTNDGLLIDETNNANQFSTGSGNFIKQTGGPFAVSSVAGPYVFDFAGLDGDQTFQGPESFVGEFTANNGVMTATFGDDNDNGVFTSGTFTGSLAADSLNPSTLPNFGRGVATIAGLNYVFYVVNSTRVRFLSINGNTMLSGDAVAQDNTIPANTAALNSGFAFLVAGSSGSGGLTRVGRFTANGATVSNVLVDTNNAGQFTQTTGATNASVTLDAANPGRGTVTFKGNNLSTPFTFVFYLSSDRLGVIQEITQSNGGVAAAVADGTIAAQTGNPFSSSNIANGYALNWSGLSLQNGINDEEDLVGQVKVTSLSLSGAADIFQFQAPAPQFDNAVSGSIVIKGDGTGGDGTANRNTILVTLTKNGASTNVNFVVYFVSPQLAFITNTSTSSTRLVAGILKAQP
jgi:hypothetical protein